MRPLLVGRLHASEASSLITDTLALLRITMCRSTWNHAPAAATLVVATLLAPGCTSLCQWMHNGFKVGPNYAEPLAPVSAEWIDQSNSAVNIATGDDYAWWTVFNDHTLSGLIDTAYQQNLDLSAAAARIVEARARRSIALGNLLPQSQQASAAYAHAQLGRNLNLPLPQTLNLWVDGFNASWELDFWGRVRRSIDASDANLDAAVEGYGDSLVILLAEVATNYVQLRTYEQRLAYARDNVQIQTKSLELVQARLDQGAVTELDVRQAKASLAQTQATIPPLEAGRRLTSNQLCILLGNPVTDFAKELEPAPIPAAPPQVAIGIPADLLRRRPDVRRAERRVAAQSAQIGIAEADLYPRLAINGFLGYAAQDFNHLFDATSFTGFILPTLQWQILNYGRIVNNVRAQNALLESTALQYQQTVLRAGREVEDALVQFIQAQQQADFLEESVTESRRAVEIAQEQFKGGVADFNRVYTNQSQLINQQDQLATVRGNKALYLIQVYKAMGGGWDYFCRGYGMPAPEVFVNAPEELPSVPPAN
jgi:NodT family efflux transporter outer membrane factor (OMF) lipoprotein